MPVSAGRARGYACAKGAGGGTSRAAGTSATVRIPNAGARCGVGRRGGGRPSGVRPLPGKSGTPRHSARAVDEPKRRPNPRLSVRLRQRVVTQQKDFFEPVCDRPGCHEPPAESIRNPARYCCSACRQAVRNVLDRERKWRSRSTLPGRLKRQYEYRASRQRKSQRRGDGTGPAGSRAPPQ